MKKLVPIRLPHGHCHPGCPWCVPEQPNSPRVFPDASAIADRLASKGGLDTEISLVGVDFGALSRVEGTALFDGARAAIRNEWAGGVRLCVSPPYAMRAPRRLWRLSGVKTVEVLAYSTSDSVLRRHGIKWQASRARSAFERMVGGGFRTGAHLLVGAAGSSLKDELAFLEVLAAAGGNFVRLLPYLLLEGREAPQTWEPMSLEQCVPRCAELCDRADELGLEIARVGLQPHVDLLDAPAVISGPDHPSLRTLVEGARWRGRMQVILRRDARIGGHLTLRFHPSDEGFVRGYHGRNIPFLRRRYRLASIELEPNPDLPRGSLESAWQLPGDPQRKAG